MSNSTFKMGPAVFKDSPSARVVAREVIEDDCYQIGHVPHGALVIDVGAFGGEFAILAALTRDAVAVACEPAPENLQILRENVTLNHVVDKIWIRDVAVGDTEEMRAFAYRANHPAGSMWHTDAEKYGLPVSATHIVRTVRLGSLITQALARFPRTPERAVVVKLDCEGAEVEIFCDPDLDWLRLVHIVTMEWHSRDGHVYRKMLERRGFAHTEISGSGRLVNGQRPPYEPGMSGGMVFASRSPRA